MINSAPLLADLKKVLASLEADLTIRADDSTTDWGSRLRDEYDRAKARERTGLAWIEWRNGEVSQAAVAWIIASVFIRFAEDNGLLTGAELDGRRVAMPWIAAPGDGLERAVENETAFYATSPTMTSRDWLHQAFRTLAALPAGRPLVDPDHSPVWHAPISATASDALLEFFRRTTPDGALVHDFNDSELDTRFLGDLYQDLSEYAKKTYALLQTPIFVEEFILDLTLTPAIAEFGLTGLKIIDPTCGSGHFLLGAFDRLVSSWAATAPNVELGERVQRALDSIHGVDLNPFAVAIARFRLTVAAIKATGIKNLVAAPAFRYQLAIGDSLLGGQSVQLGLDLGDGEEFEYSIEDLQEHADLLRPGQYHVVVGNPPYITVKDPILNQRYRALYPMCHRKYALSSPFMELMFRLAIPASENRPAGYVGQITSNSFMTREFGKRLVETFLAGNDVATRVDLTHIIDSSGASIPGHGTPTVILVGRRRRSPQSTVRAVLGVRDEPGTPADPAMGKVWREIVESIESPGFLGTYVSVSDEPREMFRGHPWSLSGGGAADLKSHIESISAGGPLSSEVLRIGFFGIVGSDEVMTTSGTDARRSLDSEATRPFIIGDGVRDYEASIDRFAHFPYSTTHQLRALDLLGRSAKRLWMFRTVLGNRATFGGGTYFTAGRPWWEWHQIPVDSDAHPWALTFAFVATHNHFVLVRDRVALKHSAPVIKLPADANEDAFLRLYGVLNSSVAAFWLRETGYLKGGGEETWADRMEYTGTRILEFPLPAQRALGVAKKLDDQAQVLRSAAPMSVINDGRRALASAQLRWEGARRTMIALQEELDWQIYAAYGLVEESLAPADPEVVPIEPNERPFEVRLARAVAEDTEQTAWFERHGRLPLTNAPTEGSQAWRELWQARYNAAESSFIKMLERPEYKRRWAGPTWDQLVAEAAEMALLDRLEAPELWHDGRGIPLTRSAAQIADDLRNDDEFRELLTIHLGAQDFDLTAEVGKLLAAEAVPSFAPLRYKETGIEKFRTWELTWEMQRAEDRGERVEVPVPPKYAQSDFLKSPYWTARGKLDVPKERFISFPGSYLPDDASELFGWAGWDHGARGQAVARLANDLSRSDAQEDQVIPLVGALLEIEPWLKQWHDDIDTRSGVSPATAVAGITTAVLARLDMGRDQVLAWRPPAATRGRRRTS